MTSSATTDTSTVLPEPVTVASDTRSLVLRGIGTILVSSVMFGVMAVFVRMAAAEMVPAQVAFFRFLGAFFVLLPFALREGLRPRQASLAHMVLRSLLGSFSILLYFNAIAGAGASLATMIHMSYPVHTAWMAALFLGERVGSGVVLALGLNILGACVALGPAAQLGTSSIFGGFYALCSCLLAGGAVTAARHLRGTESAVRITTYFMAVGALVSVPSLAMGLPPLTPGLVAALLGVILTSVAGQFLLHQGLGYAGAAQASLTATTGVITTAACEALFLGSGVGLNTILGASLILGAVAVAARR